MKQVLVSAVLMLGGFIFSNQSNSQNQSAGNVVLFSGTTSPAPITNEVFRFKPTSRQRLGPCLTLRQL